MFIVKKTCCCRSWENSSSLLAVFGEMFLFADAGNYWYDAIAQGKVRVLEIPWNVVYCFCNKVFKTKRDWNA